MSDKIRSLRGYAAAALFAVPSAASSQTIIDDWSSVKAPPAPSLKSVKVDPKTDALLLLDFDGHEAGNSGPCNDATRPRCIAIIAEGPGRFGKGSGDGGVYRLQHDAYRRGHPSGSRAEGRRTHRQEWPKQVHQYEFARACSKPKASRP